MNKYIYLGDLSIEDMIDKLIEIQNKYPENKMNVEATNGEIQVVIGQALRENKDGDS